LISRTASPDYYARIIDMCAAQGFFPRVRHEVRHWLSVVSLVAQGMGVSVVPAPLQRAGLAGVAFRPLSETTAPSEVHAAWKAQPEHAPRREFIDTVLRAR